MDSHAGMLSKIMAVGCLGVFASMGMLLFTLKFVQEDVKATTPVPMSQLNFQSLLRQGEIVECRVGKAGLVGLRRGRLPGKKVGFAVKGPISATLLRELSRRGMLKREATPFPARAPARRPAADGRIKQPAPGARIADGAAPKLTPSEGSRIPTTPGGPERPVTTPSK